MCEGRAISGSSLAAYLGLVRSRVSRGRRQDPVRSEAVPARTSRHCPRRKFRGPRVAARCDTANAASPAPADPGRSNSILRLTPVGVHAITPPPRSVSRETGRARSARLGRDSGPALRFHVKPRTGAQGTVHRAATCRMSRSGEISTPSSTGQQRCRHGVSRYTAGPVDNLCG